MKMRFGVVALVLACSNTDNPSKGTLSVSIVGSGHGSVSGTGIDCDDGSGTCSAVIDKDVALTATPHDGFVFAGWSGDCTGTGTCKVAHQSSASVQAAFTGVFFYRYAGTYLGPFCAGT